MGFILQEKNTWVIRGTRWDSATSARYGVPQARSRPEIEHTDDRDPSIADEEDEPSERHGAQCCAACGQLLGHRTTDKLTGLADRWTWEEAAADALARARELRQAVSLCILDLDRFKQINDEYGHPAGDAVLRSVATVLRAAVGNTDLVGRYGGHTGDEFLVLLPEADREDTLAVAERIRSGIKAMSVRAKTCRESVATIEGQTVSLGSAVSAPAHAGLGLSDLLLDADVALREAKRAGRDQIRVTNTAVERF
jgi:diguanylate cyclase (GGDEF)-like protein